MLKYRFFLSLLFSESLLISNFINVYCKTLKKEYKFVCFNISKIFHYHYFIMSEQIAVGIDLGTTFSCIGMWRNNQVQIITNPEGQMTTPSYVSYTTIGTLVGQPAQRQLLLNPSNTIYDIKRSIGNTNAEDCVSKNEKYWTFKVVPYIAVEIKINGETRIIRPEEVSAQILIKLKKSAEEVARQTITDVVLTVPAYFDDSQKESTIKAAELADLKVLELISEPSAAAYAYGYDQRKSNNNILVFDLGGGTLDVVIIKINDGIFDVVAIGGDTQLGGRDFDNALMDYFLDVIEKKYKKDISKNVRIKHKLLKECIDLKHMLSAAEEANLFLAELFPEIEENISIDRATFNKLCFNIFHCIEMVIHGTLREANMIPDEISEVVLVGGSSRIPEIENLIKKIFPDVKLNHSLNPDEAVAIGATLRATQLINNSIQIKLNEHGAKRWQTLYKKNTLPKHKFKKINFLNLNMDDPTLEELPSTSQTSIAKTTAVNHEHNDDYVPEDQSCFRL